MQTTDCWECKHFIREEDTNYSGCNKEELITDEEYEGKVNCRMFESVED